MKKDSKNIRLIPIIVSLILAMVVVLSGCVTTNPPASEPPLPQQPTSEPSSPPEYHTLTFTLQGEGDYSFPVYLCNNETLHLIWRIEGGQGSVWFHILTPSGVSLGFYDNEGQYANGTLMEGFCRGMTGGMTQFSPSDYNWGEGYYTMLVNDGGREPVTVIVEYWIEK